MAAVAAGGYHGGKGAAWAAYNGLCGLLLQHYKKGAIHTKSALVRCPMLLIIFRFDFLGVPQCKFYTFQKTYIGEIGSDFLKG